MGSAPTSRQPSCTIFSAPCLKRRTEWNLPTRKAYDTAAWCAIDWMFERRQLPMHLQCAYWRKHCGRVLHFHTADGTVPFSVAPIGGMPQSAPESPLVYAALVEELLDLVDAHLLVNDLPAGIQIKANEATASQVQAAREPRAYRSTDIVCYNFADATYVFGPSPLQLFYACSVIATVFSRAQQILHSAKSEVLFGSTLHSTPRGTIWTDNQLRQYIDCSGTSRPADGNNPQMKADTSMIVLGSMVTLPQDAWQTLAHRMRSAWKAWSGIMEQVRAPRISFHLRAQLLDGVVLPSLLWGLESLSLTRPQRSKLTTIQRVMIGRMLHLFQRPRERRGAFFRRRERCVTAAIRSHA